MSTEIPFSRISKKDEERVKRIVEKYMGREEAPEGYEVVYHLSEISGHGIEKQVVIAEMLKFYDIEKTTNSEIVEDLTKIMQIIPKIVEEILQPEFS